MNCSRFRFLIQQWFDQPLSPQDERMLLQHVEACDSCARFQHQLDQVIQTTPEIPLPDECLPSNLEALAKRIMLEIPQEKPGFFGMLKGMFPFLGGGGGGAVKESKPKRVKEVAPVLAESGAGGSMFPHRKKALEDQPVGAARGKRPQQIDEDLLATSTRLKSLQNKLAIADDAQGVSQGLSLGSKFGMNVPTRAGEQMEDAPLTLAESIRRKMVEEKGGEAGFDDQPSGMPPVGAGGAFGGGFADAGGGFGGASGGFGGAPPQAGFSAAGGPAPFAQPGAGEFGAPPAPSGFTGGWGDPPVPGVGGDNDWKAPAAAPGDWQIAKPNTSAWSTGPAGAPPAPAVPPAPGAAGDSGSSWGTSWPDNASADEWDQSGRNQRKSEGWGDPQSGAANQGWAGSVPAADSWGNAPGVAPSTAGGGSGANWNATPAAPGTTDWSAPAAPAGGGWSAPSAPAAPAAGGWGAPPTPAPAKSDNTWGAGNNEGWGTPGKPAGSDWGAPASPAASSGNNWGAAPAAATSGSDWGSPPAAATSGSEWGAPAAPASDWGAPPKPAAPATNSSWSAGPADAWSSQRTSGSNWPGTTGGAGEWGQPAPAAPAAAAASAGEWNSAPNAAPANPAGGWGAQGDSGWGSPAPTANQASPWSTAPTPASPPAAPAAATPAAGNAVGQGVQGWGAETAQAAEFDAWSEEGEQIQTGMWRAFQLAEPELGQPKANQRGGTQLPKPGQAVMTPDANRFEMPIQQRQKDPAAVAAAAAGKADPSMFDIPIQERMKMQQQAAPEGQWGAAPQPPAPPSPPPAPPAMQAPQPMQAPPAPPAPGGLPTKNSIMDRLNKVLGDDLEAMAAGPGMKAPPPAPQVAAPATPAYNAAQAAEPPVPPPAPPAPPAPARPDASQFDVPIQERAKQAQEPAPVAAATGGAGLFKLDDNAIDRVFSENLGVKEVARPVGVEAPAAPPAPPPAPAMPAVPPRPAVPPAVPGSPAGMTPPMPAVAAAPPAASGGAPRISAIPPRPGAAAPVPAAPAAPAAPGAADSSGLFKPLDDRAVDQIFSNLGVKEEAAPVQAAAPPPAPAPAAPPACPPLPPMPGMPGAVPPAMPAAGAAPPAGGYAPAPQPAAKQQGSGLINVDDDAMDRIFEHLGVKDKPAATVQPPKINVREVVQQIRTLADVPAPPQVPGISRLSREEAAAQPAAGKINAIGKFLLDQQDLAKIGQLTEQDLSDTKVRVLTHEASDEINRLLEHIASQPGVVGSVIVGHDGILIANSLPKEHDPETIGILSLGIYINTTNTSKKMGHNYLHQLVCRTHHGYLVIADFGGGILVTVSNAHETEKLIPLMRNITQLVAQS